MVDSRWWIVDGGWRNNPVSHFLILFFSTFLLTGCVEQPKHYVTDILNSMTPMKDQGESQTCWVYAMLAAIETEHIMRGDSVNLSAAYIEKMLEQEPMAPSNHHGMGITLIEMIQKYGITQYDAMPTVDTPVPRFTFMYGMEYTMQEFARSVCAPDEYLPLTSSIRYPYYQEVELDVPDNWTHARFLNVPMDTLLRRTERAVRQGHGVCWESEDHCMAIVGLAHDDEELPYFIMKNSWGDYPPYGGLDYLSFSKFRRETLAVCMPRETFFAK
jgi:bleomycin hydrolase